MTNVHERASAASIAVPQNLPNVSADPARWGAARPLTAPSSDAIRRTGPRYGLPPIGVPPAGEFYGGASGMSGIVSQLVSIVQQLLSMIGMGGLSGGIFGNAQSAEQYFQTASGSSSGDPHLGFNGTTGSGSNQQSRFDSMSGHDDLLDSDSFAGGYQISTSVTQPAQSGVTFNKRATVSTNFGSTQVSLDKDGDATITQNGQSMSLANGQSLFLGNGETVTRNSDGSLVIRDENGMGGAITTTLTENGHGVDVRAQANDVELGGDLLNQPQQQIVQPLPVRMPLELA